MGDFSDERLPVEFFQRPAAVVGRALIGCRIVRRLKDGTRVVARLIETEAYVGAHDLACHASKGRTGRTEVMFHAGGVAYVYFIYGMHEMLNVVTGKAGDAQAVLIRGAVAEAGWDQEDVPDLTGPGKLTRALEIGRGMNGVSLVGEALHFLPREKRPRILVTPRIGVDYAREWSGKLLRFVDRDSAAARIRVAGMVERKPEMGVKAGTRRPL